MLRLHHLFVALVLPAVLLLLLSAAPPGSAQSRPQTFKVDPGNSSAIFKVRHLGLGSLFGRFNSVRGGYTWDEGDPPNGSIRILVAAESVDTNDPARDGRFKGEQFLHADEFSTGGGDLRLIVQLQLPILDRLPQIARQGVLPQAREILLRAIERNSRAPALRRVHRHVRPL